MQTENKKRKEERKSKTDYEILKDNGWLNHYNDPDTRAFAEDFLREYKNQQSKPKKKKKGVENFRLSGKKFYLTYPMLNGKNTGIKNEKDEFIYDLINFKENTLENLREIVLEQIKKKLKHIEYFLIAKEKHDDEKFVHLHCFFQLKTKLETRDPRFFDLVLEDEGGVSINRHGEYEIGKRKNAIINYLIKEDEDFLTNMLLPVKDGKVLKPTTHLMEICKEEGMKAAKDVLYESYPDLASSRGTVVLKNLELFNHYLFEQNVEEKQLDEVYQIQDFNKIKPETLKEIIEFIEIGIEKGFTITLVLYGPPQTGKTELARSIFNYMNINYLEISDIEDLKKLDLNVHQGLLVDDLDWTDPRINRGVRLALVDAKAGKTVNVKFGAVVTGKKVPRILTLNNLEDLIKYNYSDRERYYPEVEERIKAVHIPYELSSCLNKRGKVYVQNVSINNYYFGETFGISKSKKQELILELENFKEKQEKQLETIKSKKQEESSPDKTMYGGAEIFKGQNDFIKNHLVKD